MSNLRLKKVAEEIRLKNENWFQRWKRRLWEICREVLRILHEIGVTVAEALLGIFLITVDFILYGNRAIQAILAVLIAVQGFFLWNHLTHEHTYSYTLIENDKGCWKITESCHTEKVRVGDKGVLRAGDLELEHWRMFTSDQKDWARLGSLGEFKSDPSTCKVVEMPKD